MFGPTDPEALHANATGNGADGGTSATTIVRGAEVASHMFNPTALISPPIQRAWPACIVTRLTPLAPTIFIEAGTGGSKSFPAVPVSVILAKPPPRQRSGELEVATSKLYV